MNRKQRRTHAAINNVRLGKKTETDPNEYEIQRSDGRPEVYDVPPNETPGACHVCIAEGRIGMRYKPGEIFLARTKTRKIIETVIPGAPEAGAFRSVCKGHVPKNVVIYNPTTGVCRNRDGSYEWRETERGMQIPYVPPKD